MNIEEVLDYCNAKAYTTQEFPFNETVMVMKVAGKMYLLTDLEGDYRLVLKCEPEKAIELREKYPAVEPAFHMNKSNRNSVRMDGSIPNELIRAWIDESYRLVVKGFTKKLRTELGLNDII